MTTLRRLAVGDKDMANDEISGHHIKSGLILVLAASLCTIDLVRPVATNSRVGEA